jgi:hypothetical protein
MKHITLLTFFSINAFFAGAQTTKQYNSDDFFKLKTTVGQKLGNIFSRTISYKSADFSEQVFRAAGTGIYIVTKADPTAPEFEGTFRYDGRPESHSKVIMTDWGKTVNYDGTASTNTDGSGVLYNSLIWGKPPVKIGKGDTWQVTISQPWELGGPGVQTVTVIDIDAANHTVRLKREGSGDGFYDGDKHELTITKDGKQIKMDIAPDTTHWIGYTTFQNGLVISDELMSTRDVTLLGDSTKFNARQREYILLNAMPVND